MGVSPDLEDPKAPFTTHPAPRPWALLSAHLQALAELVPVPEPPPALLLVDSWGPGCLSPAVTLLRVSRGRLNQAAWSIHRVRTQTSRAGTQTSGTATPLPPGQEGRVLRRR